VFFVCKSDFTRLLLPSPYLHFSEFAVLIVFLLSMKMEKVAKTYKATFVVNTSELGEDDPLMQNVRYFFFHHQLTMMDIMCFSPVCSIGLSCSFAELIF
jgi:hypothetical protein